MVTTRNNPSRSQQVGQGLVGVEDRLDQILARLENLEQERVKGRVEKEVPNNEHEGQKYSHENDQTHDHEREKSLSLSEAKKEACGF